MTGIETVVFDLDGTLIDSSRDITTAVNHARNYYGLRPLGVHQVIEFVGSGVSRLIEKAVIGDSSTPQDDARKRVVNYYKEHLLDETTVYPGIYPLLEGLGGNYNLAVATNKPLDLAILTIRGLGMEKVFKIIAGPETVNNGKPAPDMLNHIATAFGSGPSKVLMVGDSPIDIETARNFGCPACAVTWGYNTPEVLRSSKPDYVIHEPLDLLSHL